MNNRKAAASVSAISALKMKLEELKKRKAQEGEEEKTDRQNEKENVRGFTDGGASTDKEKEVEKDLDAQISYIENELSEFEVRMQSAILDLQEVVADMRKAAVDNEFNINNQDDMENLADQYRALGVDCEVNLGKNGYEINVTNDGSFAGENLLEMSARDVAELLDEIEEELSMENEGAEKSDEKEKSQEEKPQEKDLVEKEEGSKREAKPMALMPSDVVEEKAEKEGPSKKEDKKKDEKGDKKEGKKSSLKEVEPGERFDHGLGRGSFAAEKGFTKTK